MKLEDIIEARLGGENPELTGEYPDAFRTALRAHEALAWAVGETIAFTSEDREPPRLPPGFEVIRELGRGGMGVVYLAQQATLQRPVAVKVLRCGQTEQARLVKRFMEEARHLAQLRHPNIVAIHEVGHSGDEPYFTMDFVAGESLAALLLRGTLTPAHALAILKQVAEAVQHAHEHGIIHRDLKPGNVLLDQAGRAYVTDFGLARDLTAQSDLTRSGELLGTPNYMSPEQARGDTTQIGEATDVHALGVLLYEMLTGNPPYGIDSPAAVFARLLKDEPLPPRRKDRRIPRDLETICLKAMAKEPLRRYPTVRSLLEDLRRFESGMPITARRPGLLDRTARLARRHWKMISAVFLTAGLAVALTIALSDKSVNELRAWGKEREEAGDYAGAADVYLRAWKLAKEPERKEIQEDLVRNVSKTNDPKVAITVAREVMQQDVQVSFGKHDFMIAQALVTELRARHPGRPISNIDAEDRDYLERASARLKLFLNSTEGTTEQREEARQSLDNITYALTDRNTHTASQPETIEQKTELNTQSPEELKRIVNDPKRNNWERAEALYHHAKLMADAGKESDAKKDAEDAFERLRQYYPVYRGTGSSVVISETEGNRVGDESLFAQTLRNAEALAIRLNPQRKSVLRGGLRLRIENKDWPKDVTLDMRVKLTDVQVASDPYFRPHSQLPFQDKLGEIGVADGTYRLECQPTSLSHKTAQGARFARFAELDDSALPATVTIKGDYQEIPLRFRQLKELRILEPAAGASFDPMNDFLRWEPVPGADSYQVSISVQTDRVNARSMKYILGEKTTATQFCLGNLNETFAIQQSRQLKAGMTCHWTVHAMDKDGKRIAVTEEYSRPVLLTRDITR